MKRGQLKTARSSRFNGGQGDTKDSKRAAAAWLADTQPGGNVWIADPTTTWAVVKFVSYDESEGKFTVEKDGKQVQAKNAFPCNPSSDPVSDMTAMQYINEPGILDNLEKRFEKQNSDPVRIEMYTYMSNVLIAVNPFNSALKDPVVEDFFSTSERRPHPFAIAEIAYRQMLMASADTPTNQSIVISGESGAGKTVSAKIVLAHLTIRGGSTGAADGLDRRILDSNPITEAFGNSKTLRNNNSSRFGKLMKIQFEKVGSGTSLKGGAVDIYLLEKSRVVHQIAGERNFHAFYQLLAGVSPEEKAAFKLGEAGSYHYLNQSGCLTSEGVDDAAEFKDMVNGLTTVGVSTDNMTVIKQLLAAMLHLGNVAFEDKETAEGEVAEVTAAGSTALGAAAELLGTDVSADLLKNTMCQREVKTMGEVIIVQRNAAAAGYSRDAIAKEMFGKVFDYLVASVNTSLGMGPDSLPFIGVLDIFGFESFEKNDFEQLLINFTNETLQATFNQQVFVAETELYKREGIQVAPVTFPNNQECINTISEKPDGLLHLLDAEGKTPKPSDFKFCASIHKTHFHNPFTPKPHPKFKKENFIVRHFAGDVTYTVGSFVSKNNNLIPDDIQTLFIKSRLSALPGIKETLDWG